MLVLERGQSVVSFGERSSWIEADLVKFGERKKMKS
jgi:hypothetical protein